MTFPGKPRLCNVQVSLRLSRLVSQVATPLALPVSLALLAPPVLQLPVLLASPVVRLSAVTALPVLPTVLRMVRLAATAAN